MRGLPVGSFGWIVLAGEVRYGRLDVLRPGKAGPVVKVRKDLERGHTNILVPDHPEIILLSDFVEKIVENRVLCPPHESEILDRGPVGGPQTGRKPVEMVFDERRLIEKALGAISSIGPVQRKLARHLSPGMTNENQGLAIE